MSVCHNQKSNLTSLSLTCCPPPPCKRPWAQRHSYLDSPPSFSTSLPSPRQAVGTVVLSCSRRTLGTDPEILVLIGGWGRKAARMFLCDFQHSPSSLSNQTGDSVKPDEPHSSRRYSAGTQLNLQTYSNIRVAVIHREMKNKTNKKKGFGKVLILISKVFQISHL